MTPSRTRYFTTPLYYVTASPHLGSAYTTVLADVMKKHYVQRGDRVVVLTGTDEHGEKIEIAARAKGMEPQPFVDAVAADYERTWRELHLDFDIFYRTTAKDHVRKVQHALQTLKDRGEIVFREYEGKYCVGCERFLTDTELTADGLCPDHQRKPELRKESNYFFFMSKYRERLLAHLEKHPETIQPAHYRNEMLSFLKQPLEDLCISRPKARVTWGIELPFDSKFVTYVWFDALLNYLAATGWPDSFDRELWGSATHLIAKDILKAHSVYWLTMLLALDVSIPKICVHGYWTAGGAKMSKSIGNIAKPLELEQLYGRDTLRFFFLREMSFGLDSTFTVEAFVQAVNAYLANGIGNLASRVLTLCQKNFKGSFKESELTDADRAVLAKRAETLKLWNEGFEEIKFQNALKAWSDLVTATDLYVNEMKPWALAKDPALAPRLQVVLGVCCQLLQSLAVIIYPVLPTASRALLLSLGISEDPSKSLALATQDRFEFNLEAEVPKLFMRVQLPAPPAEV